MYPIYCINLQNRIDRKQHTKEQFARLNVPLDSVTYPQFTKDPSGGVFGCFRSHMFVWKDFLEKHPDKPYCLVLEDDFLVNASNEECQQILKDATQFLDSTPSVDLLHLHDLSIPTDTQSKPFHRGYGIMAHVYFVTRRFIASLDEIPDAIGDQIDFTISFKHDSPIYSEQQYYANKCYFTQYLNISDNYLNSFDQIIRIDHISACWYLTKCVRSFKEVGLLSDSVIHSGMNTLNLLLARAMTREERQDIVKQWTHVFKKTGLDTASLGYLLIGLHSAFCVVLAFGLVFSALDVCYVIFVVILILIHLQVQYFNACILIKIEQEFVGKTWKGDVHRGSSLFGFDLSAKELILLHNARMYMLAVYIGIRLWHWW